MNPGQCREARARVRWSRYELGVAAEVPLWFIAAFEDGKDTAEILAGYEVAMRKAFEYVGISFPLEIENGETAPSAVAYTPRGRGETR